jgi:hypothetical protein
MISVNLFNPRYPRSYPNNRVIHFPIHYSFLLFHLPLLM